MHELCHLRIHNHSPGVLQSPIALPARLGKTQDAPGFIRHIGYAAEPQQDQGRHLYFSFPDTIRAEYSWLSPIGGEGALGKLNDPGGARHVPPDGVW